MTLDNAMFVSLFAVPLITIVAYPLWLSFRDYLEDRALAAWEAEHHARYDHLAPHLEVDLDDDEVMRWLEGDLSRVGEERGNPE